jgi:hypothetical protein
MRRVATLRQAQQKKPRLVRPGQAMTRTNPAEGRLWAIGRLLDRLGRGIG